MLTAQTSSPEHNNQGGHAKPIAARFMLPDQSEHECQVTDLSVTGATFLTSKMPHIGVPLVAYIGDLGRVEARVGTRNRRWIHNHIFLHWCAAGKIAATGEGRDWCRPCNWHCRAALFAYRAN